MTAGRPLKFESPEELQTAIDEYFAKCDEGEEIEVYDKKKQEVVKIKRPIPYTITGLALALSTTRQTLIHYEERPEFLDTIKEAKTKCENWVELQALRSELHPGIACFVLKNYDWTDKQEIDNTHTLNVTRKSYNEEKAEEKE
jgi:hypothetical protein